jgi:Holliday junction resolvase YEN1
MGISELWDVLKPGFDERISLQRLVSEFIQHNSRCPRVAVDGYMFLFHSTYTTMDDESLVIRNFMSKVYYLISLNVSVVVVFDGQFKPEKLRNLKAEESQLKAEESRLKTEESRLKSTPNDDIQQLESMFGDETQQLKPISDVSEMSKRNDSNTDPTTTEGSRSIRPDCIINDKYRAGYLVTPPDENEQIRSEYLSANDNFQSHKYLRANDNLESHNSKTTGLKDYDTEFSKFKRINPKSYNEFFPLITVLKETLKQNKIDYLQAPGEGEAQCSYLQRFGVVDYVISNDVDALVFGATKVLRNFNRFKEDVTNSPKKGSNLKTSTKFYVTPVDMANVEQRTGLTTERLVFLATLRGGDYSLGVKKIGIANATRLALCGTKFATFYHRDLTKKELKTKVEREPLPDFTKLLMQCVIQESSSKVYVWNQIQEPEKRTKGLKLFLKLLNSKIHTNARDIFGRNLTITDGLLIDEYYVLLYLFPFVTFEVYKFLPNTLSFGEFSAQEEDLNLGANSRSSIEKVPRMNNLRPETIIGWLNIIYKEDGDIIQAFQARYDTLTFTTVLGIPQNYSGRIKTIIARLISHTEIGDIPTNELVKITNEKVDDEVQMYMLKYDPFAVGKLFPRSWEHNNPPDTSSPRLEFVWLPLELVKILNPFLIRDYETSKSQRVSPSKKIKLQSTTLDSFGLRNGLISPTKNRSPSKILDIKTPYLNPDDSPGKELCLSNNVSPKKLSFSPISPKRRKKNVVLPGQKNIDTFFSSTVPNPFTEELSKEHEEFNPVKLIALREDLRPIEQHLQQYPRKRNHILNESDGSGPNSHHWSRNKSNSSITKIIEEHSGPLIDPGLGNKPREFVPQSAHRFTNFNVDVQAPNDDSDKEHSVILISTNHDPNNGGDASNDNKSDDVSIAEIFPQEFFKELPHNMHKNIFDEDYNDVILIVSSLDED